MAGARLVGRLGRHSTSLLLPLPRHAAAHHRLYSPSSSTQGQYSKMGDSSERNGHGTPTRVLFCGPYWPASTNYTKEYLQDYPFIQVDEVGLEQVPDVIHNYHICVVKNRRIDSDIIAKATQMKIIMQYGVGLEGVDVNAATEHKIKVARIPGSTTGNAVSCAEMAIYLALGVLRKQKEMDSAVNRKDLGIPVGDTLFGKTVLILGFGAIGVELAKRLRPFGVKILATKRNWSSDTLPSDVGELVDKKGGPEDMYEFAGEANIVITCMTLTNETVGIVDHKFVSSMKKGSYLVNIARGRLLDYKAVFDHLESGHLAGLGIDVAWMEPFDPEDPVLKFPNVIITPHVAGVTEYSYRTMAKSPGSWVDAAILVPGNVVPNRGTGTRRDSCWNAGGTRPRRPPAPPLELDRAAAPGTEGQAARLHRGKTREAKRKQSAPLINIGKAEGQAACALLGSGSSGKRRRSEDDEDIHADGEDIDAGEEGQGIIALDDEEEEPPCQAQAAGKINPLMAEITMLGGEKGKNDGGSKNWRCNHCKKAFKSSLTRVRVHLLGAQPGKKPQIQRCPVLLNDAAKTRELRDKVKEAEQSSKSVQQKGMLLNNSLAQSFGAAERDAVDLKVLKFIAANGIPFNVLRSPYYSEMVTAINNAPKGYKGPGSEKARTTLLDALKRNVENDLSTVRDTWLTQGVSVVSDGWTNIKGQPLLNVLASNSRGSCFLYAEDYSGIEKTGEAIADFLLKAIEEIGPKNVIQVVTDNASNCKAAGREIQKVHKHIFWSPCVVHTLNLIFKDFASKFPWMLDTYKAGKAIVNFFRSHSHCLAMFRNNSRLDLLNVAKTRFASHYILLERLRTLRDGLSTTVVTRQWKDWIKSCSSDQQQQAKAVVDTINDENFWNEVDNILAITEPIYSVLRFSDGEGPKMGEIYERMDNMVGEIKDIMTQDDNPHKLDYPEVEEIIMDRWEKMNIPLHSLAFALNPKYYDQRYIEKPAPGGFIRKAPNKDPDVMKGVLEAIKKIGDDASEQKILREQFTHFISKKGMYALPSVKQDAYSMDAIDWWETYGSETPDLAAIAIKVLSQPISSSSAERIWSTYEYVHSAKRNKLNAKNADKLVYIHSNLRLLSRVTESYKKGQHSKWDIDPSDSTI